jgi:Ca-activated chloride channel family protein
VSGKVSLQIQLNKNYFPMLNTPQLSYLLLEVMPTADLAKIQMPINFCLVLDRSGSMDGQKLNDMKNAAKLAVDHLTPQDSFALVVFDDKVDILVPSQIGANTLELKQQIEGIFARGGTTMSLGMQKGLEELQKNAHPTKINRMLLLTDGATVGDDESCHQAAAQAKQVGIPIMALGLGDDWNQALLDKIGQISGGGVDFIPTNNPHIINQAFARSVQVAQGSVVQNTQLILRLMPQVTPKQVWRVIPIIDKLDHHALSERDVQVNLGDLAKDEGQTVLVELLLPPRQTTGRYRLAQAEISYDIAALGLIGEKVRVNVLFEFTADPNLPLQINPKVINTVERVTVHKLQTRALEEANIGNIPGATQKLRAAATRLLAMDEGDLAQAAIQEADNLEQKGQMSPVGSRILKYQTKKLGTQQLN